MTQSFMQTQKWAEFQKALGAEVFFIDKTLVIKYKLPFNKYYLYIPRAEEDSNGLRGIISCCYPESMNQVQNKFNSGSQGISNQVKNDIIFQDKIVFLRIEPQIEKNNKQFMDSLVKLGFRKTDQESQPSKTLILDITKTEGGLLTNLRQKNRYNIRLAEKKGVKIEIRDKLSQGEFERFWDLVKETSARDGFVSFPRDYYEKLLEIFKNTGDYSPYITIFLAKYGNKIVAVNLVMFYDETAVYLHGASDYNFRSLMAPPFLQWQAILEAKSRGMRYYDFWGIDEKKWSGVTRFKKGFGGKEIEYIGTWDYIFRPIWYRLYNVGRKIKNYL